MELFQVLYSEGEDEKQKYVLAVDEADLTTYLAQQALDKQAYISLGVTENTPAVAGPTQLTKDPNQMGVWLET